MSERKVTFPVFYVPWEGVDYDDAVEVNAPSG